MALDSDSVVNSFSLTSWSKVKFSTVQCLFFVLFGNTTVKIGRTGFLSIKVQCSVVRSILKKKRNNSSGGLSGCWAVIYKLLWLRFLSVRSLQKWLEKKNERTNRCRRWAAINRQQNKHREVSVIKSVSRSRIEEISKCR